MENQTLRNSVHDQQKQWMQDRFRGFMPVIVDVETGGFNETTDALLEVAAVTVAVDEKMQLYNDDTFHRHVEPFADANIEEAALQINQIDPFNPLRLARPEKVVLEKLFEFVTAQVNAYGCSRAILVGHNAFFDLKFLKAAAKRSHIKGVPFHQFSTLDTVTLGALTYGQTVLSRIATDAGLNWDSSKAHSALYDAQTTAELFCAIINRYPKI